jgi:hypothetical protein
MHNSVRFKQYALMLDDPTRDKLHELVNDFGQTISGTVRALILKEWAARQKAAKEKAVA